LVGDALSTFNSDEKRIGVLSGDVGKEEATRAIRKQRKEERAFALQT